MFFVVYLIEAKKKVIIPQTWVRGIDQQWKKFLNKSINRNQKYLCFYSDDAHTKDDQGRPNGNFVPDWSSLVTLQAVYPTTGCYYANLIAYKGNV